MFLSLHRFVMTFLFTIFEKTSTTKKGPLTSGQPSTSKIQLPTQTRTVLTVALRPRLPLAASPRSHPTGVGVGGYINAQVGLSTAQTFRLLYCESEAAAAESTAPFLRPGRTALASARTGNTAGKPRREEESPHRWRRLGKTGKTGGGK